MRSSGSQLDFRYVKLADEIENKIKRGVYKVGDKLPSLRKLHNHSGLSISTVYQAYIELEKRGMVEARLKSGYYVKPLFHHLLPSPELQNYKAVPQKVSINTLANSIVESMRDPSIVHFGGGAPVSELLPYKQLIRSVTSNTSRHMKEAVTHYGNPSGTLQLRRQIAKRVLGISQKITHDDIIVTNGCMEALSLCLRAVAKPGDTIVVESPTFHCLLQLIEDLNMFALEIPTDPRHGIVMGSLEDALAQHDVKACIFISNFHNPLGFAMSTTKKKKLVEFLSKKNIPIIEDDIYGELFFGKTRPTTLKSFDKEGLVLYCASFSKTLSPGLRIGWTMPGIFKETVGRHKLNTSVTSPALNQYMIADFLQSGAYDRHLRKLRNALKNQMNNTALAIARYFPEGTKLTAPQGGMMLWVELKDHVDGLELYHKAIKQKVSILPGIICSTTPQYKNFIRMSCGHPWSDHIEKGIIKLAEIIASFG